MTSVDSVISMSKKHGSARALALESISSMKITCSKSSSQSDVGASTHRSRIGANRILLGYTGLLLENTQMSTRVCLDSAIIGVHKCNSWFGNPAIRAVSKLCSSVIHLTLKIRSSDGVENLSPTLALMSESTSWLVIHGDVNMGVLGMGHHYEPQQEDTICSLYKILHAKPAFKRGLLERFIDVVTTEYNACFDSAEHKCLMLLLALLIRL